MSDKNARQIPSEYPSGNNRSSAAVFYQYLGAHSLLIGLFPFYIPVWLWRQDFSLAAISLFVAISGGLFTVALTIWERLAKTHSTANMYAFSFVLEIALVGFATERNARCFYNGRRHRVQASSTAICRSSSLSH